MTTINETRRIVELNWEAIKNTSRPVKARRVVEMPTVELNPGYMFFPQDGANLIDGYRLMNYPEFGDVVVPELVVAYLDISNHRIWELLKKPIAQGAAITVHSLGYDIFTINYNEGEDEYRAYDISEFLPVAVRVVRCSFQYESHDNAPSVDVIGDDLRCIGVISPAEVDSLGKLHCNICGREDNPDYTTEVFYLDWNTGVRLPDYIGDDDTAGRLITIAVGHRNRIYAILGPDSAVQDGKHIFSGAEMFRRYSLPALLEGFRNEGFIIHAAGKMPIPTLGTLMDIERIM